MDNFIENYHCTLESSHPRCETHCPKVARSIIRENLPNAFLYTFVNPCAGAGGWLGTLIRRYSHSFYSASLKDMFDLLLHA